MAELPAWSGVVGDAMTSAATAYLKALREPTAEQDRELTAQKLRENEADIALKQAHALHYGQERDRALKNRQVIQDKAGNWHEVPREGGPPIKLLDAPDVGQKLKDQREATIHAAMVQRMGGRPMEAWTPDEIAGPVLRPYWELLGQGRSPYAILGDKGDIILKEGSVPTRGAPAPPPPAAAPGAPTGGGETPPAPPSSGKAPETSAPATPPPSPTQRASKDQPTAGMVEGYASGFRKLDDALLDQTYGKLLEADRRKPSLVTSAQLDAIQKVKAERAGALPPTEGPSSGTEPKAPPLSAPPKPGTPPASVEPATRQRNVPLTKEAQEEEARKREDQQLQREAAARNQQQLDVTLRNEKRDEAKMAQRLKEYEESKKARNLAAQERIEKNILLETRDYRAQLTGADETIALLEEMGRYVNPDTVGARGVVRQTWQNLMGQFERSHRAPLTGEAGQVQRKVMPIAGKLMQDAQVWQADENVRAAQEGRQPTKIYVPDFSKYDPSMTFIGFLKEVIGYAQARAMNGVGRLTDQDLDRAKFALGIDDWTKSAAHVQTSLLYVQRELRNKKMRVQATMDAIEKQLQRHAPKAGESGAGSAEPAQEN